jgi:hypothetical protein
MAQNILNINTITVASTPMTKETLQADNLVPLQPTLGDHSLLSVKEHLLSCHKLTGNYSK